jgi:phosphohistidine phosphatase
MQRSLRGATVVLVTDRRRLIVMRHAKAEPFAATDHDRRLTERGRACARDAGRHLAGTGTLPDVALVSSAERTRETWTEVAETSGAVPSRVSYDDALFTGSPGVVMEAMQAVPEDATCVIFVGHNPTAAYLCHLLDDGEGDPAALSELLHGFPPGALAVLEVGVPWAELAAETGRVVDFYVGRG